MNEADLLTLLEQIKPLMAEGFSQEQAFQIAMARLGWLGRLTYGAFESIVGQLAAQNYVGAERLYKLAASIQGLAPGVTGGLSWLYFNARYLAARSMGYLAPRAGAVLIAGESVSLAGLAAGAAVLVALGGGIYMVTNWGVPDAPPVEGGERLETAYVAIQVFVPGSNARILSVRTQGAIKQGIPSASFRHGGKSSEHVQIEELSRAMSKEEATTAIAQLITPGTLRSPPLADGYVADVGGDTITIDDWGSIDFMLLRELVK